MCNIVWREVTAEFPKYLFLAEIAEQNSDGVGAMWVRNGKLEIMKQMEFDYGFYRSLPEDVNLLIHFRFATHGTVTEDNVHPFRFAGKDGEYGLMHNGILSIRPSREAWSDTRELAENRLVFVARKRGWKGVKKGIKRAISGDRIAVMRNDGIVKFFGEWNHDKDTGIYTSSPTWGHYWRPAGRGGTSRWWNSQGYNYGAEAGRSYDNIDEAMKGEWARQNREEKEEILETIDEGYFWAEDESIWTEEERHEQRNILFNRGVSMLKIETLSMADMLRLDAELDKQEWVIAETMKNKGFFDEADNWKLEKEEGDGTTEPCPF